MFDRHPVVLQGLGQDTDVWIVSPSFLAMSKIVEIRPDVIAKRMRNCTPFELKGIVFGFYELDHWERLFPENAKEYRREVCQNANPTRV